MPVQAPSASRTVCIGVGPLPARIGARREGHRAPVGRPSNSSPSPSHRRLTSVAIVVASFAARRASRGLTRSEAPGAVAACRTGLTRALDFPKPGRPPGGPCQTRSTRRRDVDRPDRTVHDACERHERHPGDHPRHRPGPHRVPPHLELGPPRDRPVGVRLARVPRRPGAAEDVRRVAPPRARSWPSSPTTGATWAASSRDSSAASSRRRVETLEERLELAAAPEHDPGRHRRRRLRGLHRREARPALPDRRHAGALRHRDVGRRPARAQGPRRSTTYAGRSALAIGVRAGDGAGSRRVALERHHGRRHDPAPRPRVGGALLVPHVGAGDRRRRARLAGRRGRRRAAAGHGGTVRRRHGLGGRQRVRRDLVPARLPAASRLQAVRLLPLRARRGDRRADRSRACARRPASEVPPPRRDILLPDPRRRRPARRAADDLELITCAHSPSETAAKKSRTCRSACTRWATSSAGRASTGTSDHVRSSP